MTSQSGQQIITTPMLPNISRSKGNQTIKLNQLIEHDMWNFIDQMLSRK